MFPVVWSSVSPQQFCPIFKDFSERGKSTALTQRRSLLGTRLDETPQIKLYSSKQTGPIVAKVATFSKGDQLDSDVVMDDKKLKVLDVDPLLASHLDHLQYRYDKYLETKQKIETYEGGLEKFALADEDIYNLAFHFPQKRLAAVVASVFSSTSEENSNSVPADSTPYSNLDVETQGLKLNLNLPRRRLQISFTCNACGARSQRLINPNAYARGTIFVQCAGCEVYHKLVDNLGLIEEYDFREYTNSNEGGEADLDSATVDDLTNKPSGPEEKDDTISKE